MDANAAKSFGTSPLEDWVGAVDDEEESPI